MLNKRTLYNAPEMVDLYLKYRPTYDDELFETIISFCKETATADFSLALDVGCGSGQSAVPLTKHFQKVIGLDASEAMITRAPTDIPNLSFQVGLAEDLFFVDTWSVDLVTVGQALHWMDCQQFNRELDRILKPGGALVVHWYGMPVCDDALTQEITNEFEEKPWTTYEPTTSRKELRGIYNTYQPPFDGWRRRSSVQMVKGWTVDEFVGFLQSISPYHKRYMDNLAGNTSTDVRQRLQKVYQDGKGRERKIKLTFHVDLLQWRKPQ